MLKHFFISNRINLNNIKVRNFTSFGFKREIAPSDFLPNHKLHKKKSKLNKESELNNDKNNKKSSNNGSELFWPKYGNSLYDPDIYSKKK